MKVHSGISGGHMLGSRKGGEFAGYALWRVTGEFMVNKNPRAKTGQRGIGAKKNRPARELLSRAGICAGFCSRENPNSHPSFSADGFFGNP